MSHRRTGFPAHGPLVAGPSSRRPKIVPSLLPIFALSVLLVGACAQPQAKAAPEATATPAPTSTATATPMPTAQPLPVSQADSLQRPAYCVPAERDAVQEVTTTPASPYLVHHPASDDPMVPTVVFLPGGSGSQRSAYRAWDNYLSGGKGVEAFRTVIPYSVEVDFIDEAGRTFSILDEVLACYSGSPARVHLGGWSNGGRAAFVLMLDSPERFATLLGAPGYFLRKDPAAWAKALTGKAVFNGVGANDAGWKAEVKATHEALAAAGIDSLYVEFAGQGHSVTPAFDESVFFDFWAKHSALLRDRPDDCA